MFLWVSIKLIKGSSPSYYKTFFTSQIKNFPKKTSDTVPEKCWFRFLKINCESTERFQKTAKKAEWFFFKKRKKLVCPRFLAPEAALINFY